jgi:hypothetical protein
MKTLAAMITLFMILPLSLQVTHAQTMNQIQQDRDMETAGQVLQKVIASEMTLTLPTTRIGFAHPSTLFLETGGRDHDFCYPAPFRNQVLREKPVNIDWRIVVLENENLRVEFVPDFGGMIWRLYDKVHEQDVLHAPGIARPTADGFGGTYMPGGLELNYPYAHSITNTWPRKTEYRENEDGSATYVVSEWERNGRTQWSMAFTLMPGESRLKQEVTLYNRSKVPASFVYWGNARVPADADTRWIEPEAMASEHGGSNLFTWPIFRGVDLSLMRNDPEVIGMYFLEPRYNFFGLTNLRTMSGMVHYADRHDVPGKKLWNWGITPWDGPRKWDPANYGGHEPHVYGYQYGEVQSGRIINQDHLEWLMPEEFISWQEMWSPIHGLSNVNEVTEDAAFQLKEEEMKLLGYSFTGATDITLRFLVDGKQVKEMNWTGKPSQLKEIDLSSFTHGDLQTLEIRVEKAGQRAGSISAVSRCKQKTASELRETPLFMEGSSQAHSTWAAFNHRLMYRQRAMEGYRKALELDPLNYHARLGLGRLLFAHGDFSGSRQQLELAIQSNKWNGEAYVLLAHIHHLQGDLDAAEERAYEARYYGEKCGGNLKLGEILICRGEYNRARDVLEIALQYNELSFRTYALLALCERSLGNPEGALAQLDRSPQGALKDMLWYAEARLAGLIDARQLEEELFQDEWRFLEIALDYLTLGALKEADQFADAGMGLHRQGWKLEKLFDPERMWDFTRKRETPFFYLIKAEVAQREGRTREAERLFAAGDYFEYYVDANQPEILPVLESASEAGNGFASYWLGNFYYHSLRPEAAKTAWDEAASKHPGHPQILRNLAVYAKFQEQDLNKSRNLLREALSLNANDVFLRQELIATERDCGASPDDVLKIYLEAPKEQRDSYLHNHGLMQAFMEAEKWSEAVEYLSRVDRRWSEDVKSWYDFCIRYADYLVDHTRPEEALQWIEKSASTPPNISNASLPVEHSYRQHEFFLAGLAYEMLGENDKSQEFYRLVTEEPTNFLFNEHLENMIQKQRFYVALAMDKLGMESAAKGMLAGINSFRLQRSLVTLTLNKSALDQWNMKDPLTEPAVMPSSH